MGRHVILATRTTARGEGLGGMSNAFKTLLQLLAVLCMAVIVSMVLHKGLTDISALAQKHSGEEFWPALGKYFLTNLAGG